jgi:hypothetical protein
LGNSYTAFNNLPNLVQQVAQSQGDSLHYAAFTPGGQYLQAHATDQAVQDSILQGDWDYILMQEQSIIPVIPHFRQTLYLPGATNLKALRDQGAPCARLRFFLTWGRENGGQQCNQGYCSVNFSDFGHYQDTLTWAYKRAADSLGAGISPVGEVWRAARQAHSASLPQLGLFDGDGSHPSLQGSYLAALTLYSTLFQRPVDQPGLHNPGVDSTLAQWMRGVVDSIVWPQRNAWRLPDSSQTLAQLQWPQATASWQWSLAPTADSLRLTAAGLPAGLQVRWVLAHASSGYTDTLSGRPTGLLRDSLPLTGGDTLRYHLLAYDSCDTVVPPAKQWVVPASTERASSAPLFGVQLYPNPAQSQLTLRGDFSPQEPLHLRLTNLQGRVVLRKEIAQPAQTLHLRLPASLSPGLYHLRLQQGSRQAHRQLMHR